MWYEPINSLEKNQSKHLAGILEGEKKKVWVIEFLKLS